MIIFKEIFLLEREYIKIDFFSKHKGRSIFVSVGQITPKNVNLIMLGPPRRRGVTP